MLISGNIISHTNGSSDIVISESGIYLVLFHATVGVLNATIPAVVALFLTVNGAINNMGAARHIFASSSEVATVSFHATVSVTTVPTTLTVLVENSGFIFSDVEITVLRLGEAT